MFSRREFLGTSLGAGALALTPELLRAFQSGKLIQRAIPSTREMLPALGLAFSNHPNCADHAALKEVFKGFAAGGGRVLDSTLSNAASEQFQTTTPIELGIQNNVFWSTKGIAGASGPPQPGGAGVKAQIDSVLARTKAQRIDLAWLAAARATQRGWLQ
jgi:hypothetical protein